MSITTTRTRHRSRHALSIGLAAALAGGALALATGPAQADDSVTVSNGSISWGLESSFRTYITGSIANGSVTATSPATDDGTQTRFPETAGTWSDSAASVKAEGSVTFTGHNGVLNLTITDPSIVVDSDGTKLVADVTNSSSETYDDLTIATLNLIGKVTKTDTAITISQAPATLTAAGEALFAPTSYYSEGQELDPVDAVLPINQTAKIEVSKTSFTTTQTATVTVTGSGFEPSEATATRPPIAGSSAGVYVVIGKFADTWKPSESAPSTNRKALSSQTKWAVLSDDMASIGGTAGGAIELTADGTFTTTLTFTKAEIDAISGLSDIHTNYGIYVYPGGGASRAEWERSVALTFTEPASTGTSLSVPTLAYGAGGTAKVTITGATSGTVVLSGAGSALTASVTNGSARFTVPKTLAPGRYPLVATYTPSGSETGSVGTATLTVAKATPVVKTSVITKPTTKKKGKVKVVLSGPSGAIQPSGRVSVRFTKGSKFHTVSATSTGTKTVTVAKRAKGTWTVSVRYAGSAYYEARGYLTVAKVKVKK